MTESKAVVLSGIRATGRMHLGNYLGVLERFARMSKDPHFDCLFFIADLHTLTTLKDAKLIREHAPNIVLDMLAAGVDSELATIYAQSDVPAVTELTWLLACLTPAGDLQRLPTFKDKVEKHADDVNAGLLFYPVLMAADILGPKADMVPVGIDQKPHLEMTRDLAKRFNRLYGDFFPIPDALETEMILVPGLVAMDSEGRFSKMGKSEASGETIHLSDAPEAIEAKIKVAPTDPARVRRTDPGTPSKCVIFTLHGLLSSDEEVAWSANGCRTAGISCLECKAVLARNTNQRLAEFRQRRAELAARPEVVKEIIREGGRKAQRIVAETTAAVAELMGITRLGE